MTLDYESSSAPLVPLRQRLHRLALEVLAVYLVVSIVTLPFLDSIWIGELPVVALIQLPKVEPAKWLRETVATPVLKLLGLSLGSPSPDHIRASPYALALVYLIPLLVALMSIKLLNRTARTRRVALLVIATAIVDYVMTLSFAQGPGLTIY